MLFRNEEEKVLLEGGTEDKVVLLLRWDTSGDTGGGVTDCRGRSCPI